MTGRNVVIPWLQAHTSHEDDDCLIWPFTYSGNGYGWVKFRGRSANAPRAMCVLAHGEPPTPNSEVLHSCDNRKCVNPRHLSWGSHSKNCADAYKRGRRPSMTRLTTDQFSQIRRMLATRSQQEIAGIFGISQTYVSRIKLNPHAGKTARKG